MRKLNNFKISFKIPQTLISVFLLAMMRMSIIDFFNISLIRQRTAVELKPNFILYVYRIYQHFYVCSHMKFHVSSIGF